MMFGLVNVSLSLPEWQAVKMTFFAPCFFFYFLFVPLDETSSAAAVLQNDFKKRYKRAAKGLAAAVAKNGCFALQGKPFDSDKQRCSRIPESRSALQSGCKVASNFKTKNVVPGNVLPLVSTKKKKCRLQ